MSLTFQQINNRPQFASVKRNNMNWFQDITVLQLVGSTISTIETISKIISGTYKT